MWQREEKNGLMYFTLPQWDDLGAKVVFTCRSGGISAGPYDCLNLGLHVGDDFAAVLENRKRVLSLFGVEGDQLVTAQQTHTKQIRLVTAADGGVGAFDFESAFPATDGFFTTEKGLVLATFYADCLPIVAFSPQKGVLGMAHSGWKGTYENIGGALVDKMASYEGVRPQEILVALGAGIGPCCYRVGDAFFAAFLRRHDRAGKWFRFLDDGSVYFNNRLAVETLLLAAGIKKEHIAVLPYCTSCDQEHFFSYRRDQGHTGRQGLFASLKGGEVLA